MALAHVLGFPQIGAQRALKFAQELFWKGTSDETALRETGATLRAHNWKIQTDAGLDFVTVGDFVWYDQILGMLTLLRGRRRKGLKSILSN